MLVEWLISETPGFQFGKWTDLVMMTAVGGRERTRSEFAASVPGRRLRVGRHYSDCLSLHDRDWPSLLNDRSNSRCNGPWTAAVPQGVRWPGTRHAAVRLAPGA